MSKTVAKKKKSYDLNLANVENYLELDLIQDLIVFTKMDSDDDMPPPLEDMSEMIQKKQQ